MQICVMCIPILPFYPLCVIYILLQLTHSLKAVRQLSASSHQCPWNVHVIPCYDLLLFHLCYWASEVSVATKLCVCALTTVQFVCCEV